MAKKRKQTEVQQTYRMEKVRIGYVSEEQRQYMSEIWNNTVTLCHGPAGTGKTHIAICAAINHLIDGKVSNIVIARPAVVAGRDMGALPGSAVDKVRPFVQPALDLVFKCQTNKQWMQWAIRNGALKIVPVELMRGMNFEDSFVVVDEAQNLTPEQFKMCITRICRGSKMVMTGDTDQTDVYRKGGFKDAMRKLHNVEKVSVVELTSVSMARDPVVSSILRALSGIRPATIESARPLKRAELAEQELVAELA